MPPRNDSPNRNEAFGRLLSGAINSIATYEGKTAPVIEEELGALAIVAGKTIQRYKAGHLPPEPRTIEILAEAAIRRGFLGREWLQRFLHAARYPFADKLLDGLCPLGPARPRPPRVYHNLPAPTYSQFVMRKEAFTEVREGLGKQSAITLIIGLGGNGKTSLAREVAAQCLTDAALSFDAVVWVSDKDRPSTTNLSVVLDEVARVLDYPGFTQFEYEEKRREVENLLRRQRVLIVVDNFETITDSALLAWLQNLSEPSKALLTAREYRREFRRGGWLVELRGMTKAEAHELVVERLRVLRIEKQVSDQTQLEPLLMATGGNPKAIEIALGLIKHERRSLQQVIDDLYAARGELFNDLFTRAWALLDEAARRVLLVNTFFLSSASSEALAATADVQGYAFERAIERLTDLALLDVQQVDLNSLPRYTLHPMVRAFAGARLAAQPNFEAEARVRWVGWYIDLVSNVGWCWNQLEKLELLDPEQENVSTVILWTSQHESFRETLRLTAGIAYYFDVRGFCRQYLSTQKLHANTAHMLHELVEEMHALTEILREFNRQGLLIEAERILNTLRRISLSTDTPIDIYYRYKYASCGYFLAKDDIGRATEELQECLNLVEKPSRHIYIINVHGLATCLYRKGDLFRARQLYQEALHEARQLNYERVISYVQIRLAVIDLDLNNFEDAEERLKETIGRAKHFQDRKHRALSLHLYARLHILQSDFSAARTALVEAIDIFERLGIRRELAEARAELAQLDAREQVETVA
jgi:LuxR family glucitol operon transcriptional activator